jgi:hypothetical protein
MNGLAAASGATLAARRAVNTLSPIREGKNSSRPERATPNNPDEKRFGQASGFEKPAQPGWQEAEGTGT